MRSKLMSLGLALVLLLSVVASPTAAAASQSALDLEVTQDGSTGEVTIAVLNDTAAVTNATVTVSSNESYAGNGTYETDENGTVTAPAPEEPLTATVSASDGNSSGTLDVDLVPPGEPLAIDVDQGETGEVSVTVTRNDSAVSNATLDVSTGENESYTGNGTYQTDENGTVALPGPAETVNVTVEAAYENDTATATATLSDRGDRNSGFAAGLVAFIEQLKSGGFDGPMGLHVVEYIFENRAGGPTAQAQGPPSPDEGPAKAGQNGDDRPGNADSKQESERGRPDHAGKSAGTDGVSAADGGDDADGDEDGGDEDDGDEDGGDEDDGDEGEDGDEDDENHPGKGNANGKR